MNVVVALENLTPGQILIYNLSTGVMSELRLRITPPYNLVFRDDLYVLRGRDRVHGWVGVRVNMARDMLRRLEFVTLTRGEWQPYTMGGYTSLLIPKHILQVFMSLCKKQ